VPAAPNNATDAMFNALDEFLMKMKEVDRRFMVFPHNITHYGSFNNLPQSIKDPEDLPTDRGGRLANLLSASQAPFQWGQHLHDGAHQ